MAADLAAARVCSGHWAGVWIDHSADDRHVPSQRSIIIFASRQKTYGHKDSEIKKLKK